MTARESALRRALSTLDGHGLWLTALLTVAVFLGGFLYGQGTEALAVITSIDPLTLAAVLGLTTVGYVFRFAKWHFYLRRVDVGVSLRLSVLTFLSGLMMVVTPGKAGELWKAWFLRDRASVPVNRTASVVGAERVTDLVALSAMAATGVLVFRTSSTALLVVVGLLIAGIGLLQWRGLCLRVLGALESTSMLAAHAADLREFYENTYALFRVVPLSVATSLSVAAWSLEGVALYLILESFNADATVVLGLFVFGLGSVVGALSLLPGGLGAAEASMVGVLVAFGYPEAVATVTTLVIRIATLWYAAILGTSVFSLYKWRTGRRGG